MKKLPLGIQNIREIVTHGYVYVDKTHFVLNLIEHGKHYCMSRPKGFGKSLLVNTLEEVFAGNRDLFTGLAIGNSDYPWQKHAVLHFDFAQVASNSVEEFELGLKAELVRKGQAYGIPVTGPSVQFQLKLLVEELAKIHPVVVLVDEYDSAIINNLKNIKTAESNRDLLRAFFGTLKGLDRHLKFSFVTGVSKFTQVSLFSGPNNLTDITMDPRYAGMMGYTEQELCVYFKDYIQDIARVRSAPTTPCQATEVVNEIRRWYNGYRFSEAPLSVYNPYSTLRYLSNQKAESYWYSTGTPSFLIEEAKKHPQSVVPLSGYSALKSTLSDISRLDRIHLAALMFQTGYLTIHGYNPTENSYDLAFPNREVHEAFFNSLLQEFTEVDPLAVTRAADKLRQALQQLNMEEFFSILNSHFAKIPYHIFNHAKEGFYQAVFFTFLETCGIKTGAEIATNLGRIDLMTETTDAICIFELKLNKMADIALTQAETTKYRERFLADHKHTLVVGVNFSSQSRNISDWKARLFAAPGLINNDLNSQP